ncbi:uncharacterized protein EDB91DRAFT_1245080 [Suillus paluster]|uniref:uncharacterized protein n=1 Tax=Suillus paluster TaxID=48578 RepID=UPI001B88116E|nr:uncharacterized protein EDB91DRAFT_1245080 [Suillus paluster]KAG1748370.1 hypothetical protein EDB91DRAFT_1245080 [Suillus paluster]
MVNRRISKYMKECALSLWDQGWELENICEALGVSRFRWRKIFAELGTVVKGPSPLVSRTRMIMRRALMTAIEDLYAEDSDLFLNELILNAQSQSSWPLSQNASEDCAFKDSLQNDFVGDGSEFVVLDETSKNERTYAWRYSRAPYGQRAQLSDVFVRGDRYSLCAAMTADSYLATPAVEGWFDAQEFYDL